MKKIIYLSLVLISTPFITFAAEITDLKTLIVYFSGLISDFIIPLLVGVAVVAFMYGIIQYFLNPENEEKRKQGKSYITWGLVALFIMISFWGIVRIAQNTFDTQDQGSVKIPQVPEK